MLRYLLYLLFLAAFILASCKNNIPSPSTMATDIPNTNPTKNYTYLALGDSYTIGESVPEIDQWGVQLAGLLRTSGLAISNPVTIARTGWTTAELAQAIEANKLTQTFDLVSLLIGVNNQYRGQSLETYRIEFEELLKTSIRFAQNNPSRVMVLSIPDWGQTPFAQGRDTQRISQEIDAFNAAAQEITQKAGVTFINITLLTKKAAGDASYVAKDGLHYSGKMHQEWAQLALPVAQKLLK